MAAVAQGIKKVTTIGRQSALGTPKTGAGGQILRRRTSVFQANRATFASDEIASHHQSTGVTYGLKSTQGKISALLSPGTYQLPMEGILEKVFAATAALVVGVDCTTAATAPQFVDGSAGYLAAGLKVGDVVRWTGFTTTAVGNNNRNFLVTALTAGNMSGVFLDGGAAVAVKAPETGSVTVTVVGKKCFVPLTGHTKDYFTVEEWYSDLSKSELFPDCNVSQLAFGLPATGNATLDIDMIGLSRTLASAESFTSPAAETTTGVMTAVNGAVYVGGVLVGNVTGATVNVANSAANAGAVVGSNSSPDTTVGRVTVSGQFTALFSDAVITALYDAETPTSLILVATVDQTGTSDFVALTMGRVKITGDTPDDGEKSIVRTYPFTAELNTTGGSALAWDETILTIQDSAAV